MPRTDALLFAIPLWHQIYLLIWPAWLNAGVADGSIAPDQYLAVVVAACLSLAAHARAALAPLSPARSTSAGHRSGSTRSRSSTSITEREVAASSNRRRKLPSHSGTHASYAEAVADGGKRREQSASGSPPVCEADAAGGGVSRSASGTRHRTATRDRVANEAPSWPGIATSAGEEVSDSKKEA